ncbi:YeeE/YedE family protein [Sinisalibacter aestuarii]|uniref:Membrane protein n=1 Tax=Sinisalibacter aestuarii TaxID=2949426 RepID=A0ABQ5LMZ4_9RHOB|nr:YeeE/YedE family protein [Sinisalibacter aestuarii]GKY86384.1 membrane protein [Sinisalibacter aestuarii]
MLDMWREAALANPAAWIGWGGLIIGIVFGFTIQRTNFCTMGSISDILSFGDYRRFRSWLMAAGVAVIGVAVIERLGAADLSYSIYTGPTFQWGGHIIGGLLFGIGMVFGGGCVSKNLARAGGGDLRSLIVLVVIGIAGYMTIGGLFAQARIWITTPLTADLSAAGLESQRVDEMIGALTGMGAGTANLIAVVLIAGALLVYAFADTGFRQSRMHLIAGLVVGLCVLAGWMLTGLALDDFADNPRVESLSYVRPAGDTLDYLMRFTAYEAPSFTVVTLLGALIGAFLSAITNKSFAFATFTDAGDTLRNIGGAVLMGIGGVTALGCTIGQSVSGVSTLALGSLITFVFIVIGGVIGMKAMEALA